MQHLKDTTEVTDEMIMDLLDKKEAGKSFPEALASLGQQPFSNEESHLLRECWDIHGGLMRSASVVSPRPSLLRQILLKVDVAQSTIATIEKKASPNINQQNQPKEKRKNILSSLNWNIVTPIAIVFLMVVVLSQKDEKLTPLAINESTQDKVKPIAMSIAKHGLQNSEAVAVKPESKMMMKSSVMLSDSIKSRKTGIEAVISTLSTEATGDIALLNDSVIDTSLVTSDTQALDDLNSAYDEKTF